MRKILSFFSKSNPKPLFILGNPKSGTTIIANLLSKATKQSLTSDIKSITKYSPLLLEFELIMSVICYFSIRFNTFLHHHLNWQLSGYYDYNSIWLSNNALKNKKDLIWVDLNILPYYLNS